MSRFIDALSDDQRQQIVDDRIWQREELADSPGLYSKSKALSQEAGIFQLGWCKVAKAFDHNCPPVGTDGAFYNHSQMADPYGERWVAIEPPTQGREGLYWDTILHTSKPDFWGSRQGSVIIDLSTTREDGQPPSYLTSDRFQGLIESEVEKYGCRLTTGVVDGESVTHLHYKHWRNGKPLTQPAHKEALFELAWSACSWMESHQVSVQCVKSVGRTGTLTALTSLFRGLQCGFVHTVVTKSELPPLETDDTLTVEVDRLCNYRACTEEPHHFTLLREGVKWWETKGPSRPVALPKHELPWRASPSTSE